MWTNRFLGYENRLGLRPAIGLRLWQSGSVDFVVSNTNATSVDKIISNTREIVLYYFITNQSRIILFYIRFNGKIRTEFLLPAVVSYFF